MPARGSQCARLTKLYRLTAYRGCERLSIEIFLMLSSD